MVWEPGLEHLSNTVTTLQIWPEGTVAGSLQEAALCILL